MRLYLYVQDIGVVEKISGVGGGEKREERKYQARVI